MTGNPEDSSADDTPLFAYLYDRQARISPRVVLLEKLATTRRAAGARQSRPRMSAVRGRPHVLPMWSVSWLLVVSAVAGCGDRGAKSRAVVEIDPGPVHVHGLGVNPADGALFVATHTGLFRAGKGERTARRVAGRYQDTMGFAVVGPDRFLGSGHPDLREKLPPFLGLIESRDAGRSWRAISLQGSVDFHVLEASGRHVLGYGSDWDTREPRFLTSSDGGRRWRRLDAPEPLASLAISPTEPRRLIASGERRVYASRNSGRSWARDDAPTVGLLAWNDSGMFVVGRDGRVWRRPREGAAWQGMGDVGGSPAAFDRGLVRSCLWPCTTERSSNPRTAAAGPSDLRLPDARQQTRDAAPVPRRNETSAPGTPPHTLCRLTDEPMQAGPASRRRGARLRNRLAPLAGVRVRSEPRAVRRVRVCRGRCRAV